MNFHSSFTSLRQIGFVVAVSVLLSCQCHGLRASETLSDDKSVPRVILDTDPSSDPDDVGCMAMLHNLASLGECEILAVINSIHHREGSLTISAINQFYRRPAIPVGDYKGYGEHVNAPEDLYSHMVARTYPRELKDYSKACDSVSLYREILASADPKSITVVVIGTMHNLSALLKSEACEFSSLSGVELVEAKVRQVVTMGGNFINGKGHDRTNWGGSDALCGYTAWSCLNKERNAMCRFVIENCKASFVASGWEVGCGDYHDAKRGNVMTGQVLKGLEENHIVRRSYEYHFAKRGGVEKIDRHSNDQCALLYALRGEGENFKATINGKIELTAAGDCLWRKTKDGMQGYISKKRSKELIAAEIEELMMGKRHERGSSRPSSPSNIESEIVGGRVSLRWDRPKSEPSGNWVVAYHIYKNDRLVGTAYGTQFFSDDIESSAVFEVRSVNSTGFESHGVIYRK